MNSKLTFEEKYSILGSKNTTYDGLYFTAVKTTGIFCHPSCRARIPKIENVAFFSTIEECLENGFRPCKICKPMDKIGETPNYIVSLIAELHKNPHIKISNDQLKERGVEPHTIRRWFKKNYAITFQSFQRMLRLNYAFENIKKGNSITQSAYESGYESLSGFNESYRSIFGKSASKTKNSTVINVLRFSSPIGSLIACATEKGLCFLGFVGQKRLEEQFIEIQKVRNAVMLPGKNPHLTKTEKQINEYFAGTRTVFSIPFDLIGTDFRKLVWQALTKIPYGKTITYKGQAIAMNHLKAIRAIASSNGANKISIIIPCHRVIGTNGKLTGYAGGIHKKKWLLEFENKQCGLPQQMKLL